MQRKLSYAEQVQWLEDYLGLNGDELPTCDARLKRDVADFMDSCWRAGDVIKSMSGAFYTRVAPVKIKLEHVEKYGTD